MVSVTGTKGNTVSVQILGISETLLQLRLAKVQIEKGADFGVIRAGTYVTEETKASVMGNRAEHKSVDTGQFVNDIQFSKTGNAEGQVHAPDTSYAGYVEHSTRMIGGPRRHFGNTEKRTGGKVKDIIQKEINTLI